DACRGNFRRGATPRPARTKPRTEFTNAVRMLGGDEDRAVGIDGDVQGFALSGERVRAQFTVAHAVGKENGYRATAAIGDVDGRAGIDGDVGRTQVAAIILEGE